MSFYYSRWRSLTGVEALFQNALLVMIIMFFALKGLIALCWIRH